MSWNHNHGVKKQSKRPIRSERTVKAFIALVKGTNLGYNAEAKAEFHDKASGILYSLALALGYTGPEFEVRHNQGGIAVSGEITLHSETLYVQLSQTCLGPDWGFMWRTVKSRKDYTGGPNQWAKWEELLDIEKLARKMEGHFAKSTLQELGLPTE